VQGCGEDVSAIAARLVALPVKLEEQFVAGN